MKQRIVHFLKLFAVQAGIVAEMIWDWWTREITDILPARWSVSAAFTAELPESEFIFFKEKLGERCNVEKSELRGSVIFRVSPEWVLRRTLSLPLSARFRLRQILANDLDRQSPIHPSRVLFTHRIVSIERASARLLVSLLIVRRDIIERNILRLQSAGLRVRHAQIDDPQGRHVDRLFLSIPTSQKMTRSNQLSMILAGLTICLLAVDAFIRLSYQHAVMEGLTNEAAELQVSADRVSRIRVDLNASELRAEFLAMQRKRVTVGAILAQVTELLPDGTWIYSLDFDGHQVQIQGYSTAASSLVARFDSSAFFSSAGFRAPMTQGPRPDLQQFDLSMNFLGGS